MHGHRLDCSMRLCFLDPILLFGVNEFEQTKYFSPLDSLHALTRATKVVPSQFSSFFARSFRAERQAQHTPNRFKDNLSINFRAPDFPLIKNNRYLFNPTSLVICLPGHLDLEQVSAAENLIQIDSFKRLPSPTFETAGQIAEWHSCHPAHVLRRHLAQNQPFEIPVHYVHTA